jgi:predicted acetyltransferase
MTMRYGVARKTDLPALANILQLSFGISDSVDPWFDKAGAANIRVLRDGDEVVAGLILVPMGQYFGGKSVPMVGVAGVGVPPAQRGRGVATELMRRCVRELRRNGTALSALYPATMPLYRRAGYETAGGTWRISFRGTDLKRTDRDLDVREFAARDERSVRAVYAAYARPRNGWVDRGPYVWERTRRVQKGAASRGHVLCDGDRIDAYVFYRHRSTDFGFDLKIADMAARTPEAQRNMLAFLADHRSLAEEVRWFGGVDDPLLLLAREHHYEVKLHHHWMLRICDVKAALESRGYPPGLEMSIDLDIRDTSVRSNSGKVRLQVSAGSGRVRKGGRGSLRMVERTLAALYSGHATAHALHAMGRIEGQRRAVERAALLFAGPPPSMPDFF